MSHDLFAAQESITEYAHDVIPWPVYTGGIEEAVTLAANGGVNEPHVILRYSSPQPFQADASFAGATHDSLFSTVDIMSVGPTDVDARRLSSFAGQKFVGFRPNENCSTLRPDFGGGTFTVISEGSRPQFYISWASFRFNYNMISPEE